MGTNARHKSSNTIAILTTRRRTALALLLVLVALSNSCKRRLTPVHRHVSQVVSQRTGSSPKTDASKPTTISILELLGNTKKYVGTRFAINGDLEVYEPHYEVRTEGVLRVGREGAPWPWNNEINLKFSACDSKAQLGNQFVSRDQAKVHSFRYVRLVGQFQYPSN